MKGKESSLGLVFIPGAGLDSWIWDGLAAALPYPCLAVDLPGRGRHRAVKTKGLLLSDYVQSAAADLEGFSAERVVVVAHSIGTVLGLELADRYPQRVAGLVVISSPLPRVGRSYASSLPFPLPIVLPILLKIAGTLPPEKVIRDGMCQDLTAEEAQRIVTDYFAESTRLYTDKIRGSRIPENRLYVETTNDKIFSLDLQKKAGLTFGQGNAVEIDSGHLPMLSNTKELSDILKAFLATVS